jgi:HKD family nuclease
MSHEPLYQGWRLNTGKLHNDPLLPKLLHAINRATGIEIAVSFVQRSGVDLLFDALKEALERGSRFRLVTSDYLCFTSPDALKRLQLLQERGALVRVFECDEQAGFHLKSYIFVRDASGVMQDGVAWVGSNNISRAALCEAHEWALRLDYAADKPIYTEDFAHIRNSFQALFAHPQAVELDDAWLDAYRIRHQQTHQRNTGWLPAEWQEKPEQPCPNPIQEAALIALAQTRANGFQRGLVVLATGV